MFSFPILYFASSQQTHQLHSSPVRLSCFLSICCISLLINLTAIAPVNSFRVNCFFSFRTLSEYICLKRCAISESSSKSCIVRIYDLMSKCVMIVYQNAIVLNHHSITRRSFKGRTHARDVSIMYCFIPYVLHANSYLFIYLFIKIV